MAMADSGGTVRKGVAGVIGAVLLMLTWQADFVYGQAEILGGGATFYGNEDGFGTQGGNCGYGDLTAAGYSVKIAAVSAPLYRGGLGCGSCYRVKCVNSNYCTGASLVVPVTDFCPGGNWCCETCHHFDLSQPAFRTIADVIAGHVDIEYERVPCPYAGPIVFIVTGTIYWMNVLVQNIAGPGQIDFFEVSQDGGNSFIPLKQSWGANWVYSGSYPLSRNSLIFRVGSSGYPTLTSPPCLPSDWTEGTYRCNIQYDNGFSKQQQNQNTTSPQTNQYQSLSPSLSPPPPSPPPPSPPPPSPPPSPPPPSPPPPPPSPPPPPPSPPPSPSPRSPPPSPSRSISHPLDVDEDGNEKRKKGRHPPGVGRKPPGKGRHPPRFGRPPGFRHPPGIGRHPLGKGKHPPGKGKHLHRKVKLI